MDRFKFKVFGHFYGEDDKRHRIDVTNSGDWAITQQGKLEDRSGYFDPVNHPELFCVCSCTGLKDKNGNLIYEGDIINPGDAFGEDEVLIMWEDESFECHDIKTREFYYKLSSVARFGQCEIVGNVHEQK